eukprot:s2459_g10.t1
MPWVGDRRLLVGFAVKDYSEFPAELVQSLQDSAFALPATCSADFFCPAVDPLATESAAAAPKVLAVGGSLALFRDWLPSPYVVCLHAALPAAAATYLWYALLDLVTAAAARGILVSIELPASDAGWSSSMGKVLQAKCPS